jgi:hypothetical protein
LDAADETVEIALQIRPDDKPAAELKALIAKAKVKERDTQEAAAAKPVRDKILSSVPELNVDRLLNDCFEKKLSELSFIVINGKPLTTESLAFKEDVFNRSYKGQTVRYDCVGSCAVGSIRKDGTAILKIPKAGSPDIIVTPRPTARDNFRSLKEGDKVKITAVIQGLSSSKLYLVDAEIIE